VFKEEIVSMGNSKWNKVEVVVQLDDGDSGEAAETCGR
jgi:hypothetical protein